MIYTIKFDMCIDDDEIIDDETIKDFLKDHMGSASIDVYDIEILDIND